MKAKDKPRLISRKKLFIEELERPAMAGVVTTLAIGEECAWGGDKDWKEVTTLAIGEESAT